MMARLLDDTFSMGPLLRQYHYKFEKDGENAAFAWAEALSERKRAQLEAEMQYFLEDAQAQEAVSVLRKNIERSQQILGFAKN